MPTYETRRANRQDRLDARADKLRAEMSTLQRRERQIADAIPCGQPILVGHHSERRHRRDLKRIRALADKQLDAWNKLRRTEERAPTKAILSSDDDACAQLRTKIARAEKAHAMMKAANPLAKRGDVAGLVRLGFTEAQAADILRPDFCGRIGFAPYQLTNNSANIRRMKERVAHLERTKAKPASERVVNGVTVEEDPAAMRLRLRFPGKPARPIIDALKAAGFRWAPSEGAWQRQLGSVARWQAEAILKHLETT